MHSPAVIIYMYIFTLDVRVVLSMNTVSIVALVSYKSHQGSMQRRLQELTTICSEQNSQLHPLSPHINAQLDNKLLKVKASTSAIHTTTSDTVAFWSKKTFPPNKRNMTQQRFSATVKEPRRHKNGTLR